MMIYKNALISVSNKEGLADCVKKLSLSGTRIVATGKTAKLLSSHKIQVVPVEEQTQFSEMMDGRLKTLHPHIFLPLLARLKNREDEQELKKRNLSHFDLVICNLYPFDQRTKTNEKEQVELIDVGGPSLLRASAKNFEKITVICDPEDYPLLENPLSLEDRRRLAVKTFYHLSFYDSKIAEYFQKSMDSCASRNLFVHAGDSRFHGNDGYIRGRFPPPTEMTKPAEMAEPTEIAKPTEMTKPAEMAEPTEIAKPTGMAEPAAMTENKKGSDRYIKQGALFKKLRYGENPKQQAWWYVNTNPEQHDNPMKSDNPKTTTSSPPPLDSCLSGLHQAEILQGKTLSLNNILDIQSAVNTLREFQEPAFVGVKHNNPCGVCLAESLETAIEKGLKADPLSIFGGIVALNKKVSLSSATSLNSCFLECITAPDYSKEALEVLSKNKKLRVLKWPKLLESAPEDPIHTIDGGFIVQTADQVRIEWEKFKIEGPTPTKTIKRDLETAWKVSAHLKSNAIALVSQGQTVGLGMGQVDRVTAVHLAIDRMKKHHPNLTAPVVMASDGFFPFEDSIQKAASEGIQWIIQPGGSIRDASILNTARSLGLCMILTGCRHFRH